MTALAAELLDPALDQKGPILALSHLVQLEHGLPTREVSWIVSRKYKRPWS